MSDLAVGKPNARVVWRWLLVAGAVGGLALIAVFHSAWTPVVRGWLAAVWPPASEPRDERAPPAGDGDHAGHDHEGHDDLDSLELSEQARRNIGLEVAKVSLGPFERTIAVPGIVVRRPGRSTLEITAILTGVVTRIEALPGEAVRPGDPLFEIRLTHEELVQAQADFLRTAEELDVVGREIERLESIRDSIQGKTLLERKYEKQKELAIQRAQRQGLILHGLSEEQVQAILDTRTLLHTLSIAVPLDEGSASTLYQVQQLKVVKGQHVTAGDTLAVLADDSELLVEGDAFEKDLEAIGAAQASGWNVSAVFDSATSDPEVVSGLKIQRLAGEIDPESRALHFYAILPNELLSRSPPGQGPSYVNWKYRPGQRVQLLVPAERWEERLVLPAAAVVQDGPESYVFQPNGEHFDRRPVHVEYRDQLSVVVANDGSLFPGDLVAVTAAQQLQLALKNKAGGGVDPHAGHNH